MHRVRSEIKFTRPSHDAINNGCHAKLQMVAQRSEDSTKCRRHECNNAFHSIPESDPERMLAMQSHIGNIPIHMNYSKG